MNFDFDEDDNEIFKRRFRQEIDRKTFAKVFDKQTLDTLQELAQKGHFDVLEHIVSTGKEAHVFAATDQSGKTRAVKIYKKETTDFKRMADYIIGDNRFRNVRKDIRDLVTAWAKKEFKNLSSATQAHLNTPLPLAFKDNIVVMEFIGTGDAAAPRLKEVKLLPGQAEQFYKETVDFIAGYYLAGIVHADLSEYNILVHEGRTWVIDFAQAVILSHPKAREFFLRDVENLSAYFRKQGVKTTPEKMYADIKARKNELEAQK